MKGCWIEWLPEELAWIEANCTLPREVRYRRFCYIFQRQDVTLEALNALCKRKGWLTGRTGFLSEGNTPWNKGKKMPFNAASAATQFKSGLVPHNAREIGYEMVDVNGYVQVCVDEPNPSTGARTRMVHKHRRSWQLANGPVPDGHRLKCLDSDKTNCDPANWEAVPLGLAPRLNGIHGRGYDSAPAELKPTIMAVAKLAHAAREARCRRSRV